MHRSQLSGYKGLHIALGKTLIAAAWVDGELNNKELECLKSIVLQLPDITFEDWRKLKIYMAYPITTREQQSIVKNFSEKVFLQDHQKIAWKYLLQILNADGLVNVEEKAFAEELENALEESSSSFLRKIKFFLFQSRIENSAPWQSSQSDRDKFIHEFFDNPIYFIFRKAILKEDFEVPHTKPELQKICLLAAILCWFAKSDEKFTLDEEEFILKTLIKRCQLSEKLSKCILSVGKSIDVNDLQLSEVTSAYANSSTARERNELFSIISNLIMVDRSLNSNELEYLRTVALYLEISEKIWIKIIPNLD
jgi:uncharacterized tellurite resistance protein B-like protein